MSGQRPGPWIVTVYENVDAAKDDGCFEWAGRSNDPLGDCFDGGPVGAVFCVSEEGGETGLPGSVETSLANARLIAAAPDLLAALKGVMPWAEDDLPGDPLPEVLAARAAIAKAEGR